MDTHRVPINEYDNDGDGYVECSIDINPAAWYSSQVQVEDVDGNYISGLKGGDDCNDDDILIYTDAEETCNGRYDDCISLANWL